MVKTCTICREKAKGKCDHCRNEFCLDHAAKCSTCGSIRCIRELNKKTICPTCNKPLSICPECLMNGKIVRTLTTSKFCPECGWSS